MLRTKIMGTKKIRLPPEGLLCNYSHRPCTQNRLEGYDYCMRHILEDKTAPFKQCNYVYPKNGKRCPHATPKLDRRDGFCPDHTKKAALMRQKLTRKRKPVETAEKLLEELEQYVCEENREELFRVADASYMDILGQGMSSGFLFSSKMSSDCLSDNESEREPPLVDQAWHGDPDSEAESLDSELEDPLKHAGVYTSEEVALVTRDKLIRLQSLYIEQFKRLQHLLKEKRRKYLSTVKGEKETHGSISATPRVTSEEVQQYARLKALNRYHKRHGTELMLHSQAKEKRLAATEGIVHRSPSHPRCIHTVRGERCNERVLPLSKFCQKHILYDPHQVLFRTCNAGNISCRRPVVPAVDGPSCILHATLPVFPSLAGLSSAAVASGGSCDQEETEPCVDVVTPETFSFQTTSHSRDLPDIVFPSIMPVLPDDIFAARQPSPETDVEK